MSNEVILNLSFDNQTVTDLTGNWTLDGTPNATYEQIDGGSGYSLVTGTLGTPLILVAVDQEAIYNEYTIDFNLYVKPDYTDSGWFSFLNLESGMNYSGDYRAYVDNGLTISLTIGGSSREVSIGAPTNKWIHITIISKYDSDTGVSTAYLYVDNVLRTYRQDSHLNGSPFAIGKKLVLFNRGGSSFYFPNTPGLAINGLTIIRGIHVPDQNPAISLLNLSRVFNNFCTWLKRQLSTVAFTGSYNDLKNKPKISTVNNGTLTIQQNGTTVDSFTANSSTDKTVNITVPTKTSDLNNDSGFITSDNTKIPLAGTNALAGSIVPSTDNSVDLGASSKNIKMLYTKGITINGTQFLPSDYIPRSGGAVMTGTKLGKVNTTEYLLISGGTDWDDGAVITLSGKNRPNDPSRCTIRLTKDSQNNTMNMYLDGTWTWTGTACQITSDQRLKQQIAEIDDKLLDAWEDVNLVQFKYNDAVDQKKDNARLHTGYVVQQIDSACKSHNVDISEYGLYCHEEYPEETEEVEVEQADGTKTKEKKVIREASEHYSLRYTEALIVECAYLRKCIKELRSEIEELKSSK